MARLLLTLMRSRRSAALDMVACVLVGLAVATGVVVAALLALLVWLAVRHPFCTVALAATGLTLAGAGWVAVAGLWAGPAVATLAWRWRDRAGFDRRVLRRWRRTFVYGRRWRRAMSACDLDQVRGWRRRVPRLGAVRSTRWTDRVGLHLLEGQTAEVVAARSRELADALGALSCRVRDGGAGVVTLELRRGDPLSGRLAPLPVPDRPDLDALAVGVHEDGRAWTVRLARGHLLVVGAAGSGDGSGRESVVWSLVRALAARLRDGSVELWGIDGTGLGLGVGGGLFTRLAAGDRHAGVAVVEDAAALVRARGRHRPRRQPPVVLVLDEVARWGDTLDDDLRRRLNPAMELVLTHGPAAGVIVVAALRTAPASVAPGFASGCTWGRTGWPARSSAGSPTGCGPPRSATRRWRPWPGATALTRCPATAPRRIHRCRRSVGRRRRRRSPRPGPRPAPARSTGRPPPARPWPARPGPRRTGPSPSTRPSVPPARHVTVTAPGGAGYS